MPFIRDDRWVTDALGRALAGADVYYCTQPATAPAAAPPSPLATIFSSAAGASQTQPLVTDGFGHADCYLDPSIIYTVVVYHPLFGSNPVVLPDQSFPSGGGGSNLVAFGGTLSGTVDGVNKVFTLTNAGTPLTIAPTYVTVSDNFPLTPGVGFTLSGVTVTFTTAPNIGDTVYAQGFISA